MSEERAHPTAAQLEAHARGELLEVGSQLRRLEGKLADLAAMFPEPEDPESADLHPPTVLGAQLGIVEQVLQALAEPLALLSVDLTAEGLEQQWHEHRGAESRARAVRLVRARRRAELAGLLTSIGRRSTS